MYYLQKIKKLCIKKYSNGKGVWLEIGKKEICNVDF